MKILIIFIALTAVLLALVFLMGKTIAQKNRQNKQLQKELLQQQANIKWLARHALEISQIQESKENLLCKIQEAKTDEEIMGIINTVISGNNSRL